MTSQVDRTELRIALIRKGLPQYRLAAKLDLDPTVLSARIAGTRPMPTELVRRIESVLGLATGALDAKVTANKN